MIPQTELPAFSTVLPPARAPAALTPIPAFALALVLMAMVAAADYLTGYEVRLALLYLIPIALATWTGGTRMGVLAAIAAVLAWIASFHSIHPYSLAIYYYWEGAVMIVTFVTFVLLLAGLRRALARADERFLRVLESLYAGVYVVDDQNGKVLYANQRLADMVNTDPLRRRAVDFEKRFSPSNDMTQYSSERPDGGATRHFLASEVRDNANGRWYLVETRRIPWLHGQHATLKVMTDISEQKQAQTLKRQHEETLHHTTHLVALAEIASRLAHEINQPLGAIAGYHSACLRLLSGGHYEINEVVGAIEKCQEQVVRIGHIVNRTRDFVRRRRPTPASSDLNAVVREAVQLMELDFERGGVRVELRLTTSLPDVLADRVLIVQVVVNLLRNAVEAMQSVEEGGRNITVSTHVENDGAVLTSIADRGPGIPQDVAERLYTPFFTTKAQGLGLGLSICHSVIEAHGGRIWQSANSGGGCSFHFVLPANRG